MRCVLLSIAVAACGFSARLDRGDAMSDAIPSDGSSSTARKRRITIPDAGVFGNLTEFPVWLVIDDPAGLGARATLAGDDIYFTKLDGTPLEHERVDWNKATGHLEAWVRVDLVDGADNAFELRFGDPAPAHAPNAPLVFANGFVNVWHLDALQGTTVADTRNAANGTAFGGPTFTPNGRLGGAITFDGTNDEIRFTSSMSGGGSTTFSAWVALTEPPGYSTVLCIGNAASNAARFLHTKYSGIGSGFYNNDHQSTVDVHDGQFTLLHWTFDGDTKQSVMYRDGVSIASRTASGTINTTGTGGRIGFSPSTFGPNNWIEGTVDEVRIADVARSAAWIRTEHANQSNVSEFFTLGPDEPAP